MHLRSFVMKTDNETLPETRIQVAFYFCKAAKVSAFIGCLRGLLGKSEALAGMGVKTGYSAISLGLGMV